MTPTNHMRTARLGLHCWLSNRQTLQRWQTIDALSELSLSERSTVVQETAIRFDSDAAADREGLELGSDSPAGVDAGGPGNGGLGHCPPGPRRGKSKCHPDRGNTRRVGVVLTPLPRESRPSESYPAPPDTLDARCYNKFHLRTIECW